MTKTERRKLLQLCRRVLIHRRNGHVRYEQQVYERLEAYCEPRGIDPSEAIAQAIVFLRRTSIADAMNGWV